MDLNNILEKWADARNQLAVLEKRVAQYKKMMEKYMTQNNLKQYENDYFRVRLGTQNRTIIHKKDVPANVWEQYATPQQIQFITFTEKTKR